VWFGLNEADRQAQVATSESLAVLNQGPDVPVIVITRMTDSLISHSVRILGYLARPLGHADVEVLMSPLCETRRQSLEDRS
jgi:hypothetical protein